MARNPYNGFTPQQRSKAGRWIKQQRERGLRQPHTQCDACLREGGSVAGHSEDYREPFGDHIGAIGLCFPCHMAVHNRFRNPQEFDRYRDIIRAGGQFPDTKDFRLFIRLFRDPVFDDANPPRQWTWLDTLALTEYDDLYPPHEETLF
jgi:hypothetical protein